MTQIASPEFPLGQYELVHSHDVNETRDAVGAAFCEHRLAPQGYSAMIDARFHGTEIGQIGLYYLAYGAAVRIDPAEHDFYLVQIPISGNSTIDIRKDHFVSTPHVASVMQPGPRASMQWEETSRQLLVRVSQQGLQRHLTKMLGRTTLTPLVFDVPMKLNTSSVKSWTSLIELLIHEVEIDGAIPREQLAMKEFESLIMSQLILAQPNNYTNELTRTHLAPPVPRLIRQAAEMLEGHATEPITVEDVAKSVGLSIRSLQIGFRRSYDTTPTRFLREIRMKSARSTLLNADPATSTVTSIAIESGFTQLGRFAVLYRERYGELPSDTLRR